MVRISCPPVPGVLNTTTGLPTLDRHLLIKTTTKLITSKRWLLKLKGLDLVIKTTKQCTFHQIITKLFQF